MITPVTRGAAYHSMPRAVLSPADRVKRIAERSRVGTLRDNRVCAKTLARCKEAVLYFISFLGSIAAELAVDYEQLDQQICSFIEYLWADGASKRYACDVLSGAQHFLMTRRKFAGGWQLLTTWSRLELPSRAPPISEFIVQAIIGMALEQNRIDFSALLALAFHGCLRTGEMFAVQYSHIGLAADFTGTLALPWSKIGQQKGAQETVSILIPAVGFLLFRAAQNHPVNLHILRSSPSSFRAFYAHCLDCLGLSACNYAFYSLRRGGATHLYQLQWQVQDIMIRGRWSDIRTCKIYIQDGVAQLSSMQLSQQSLALCNHYRNLFLKFVSNSK